MATPRPAREPLGRTWCLCLSVQSGHPYLPSVRLSQRFLPACVPAAASHITIEPGLDGCCSESRESPIWSTGETEEERWEEDRGAGRQQSRCSLVKAKDGLNQRRSNVVFHVQVKEGMHSEQLPRVKFVIVSDRAFNARKMCSGTLRYLNFTLMTT